MTDRLPLNSIRHCQDGSLVASVRAARTGTQVYAGYEVGKPDVPYVTVYRPEAEVFARDSMASYAAAPVTIEHPAEMVTADNWKKYAVGDVGADIVRDGEAVRVPLLLRDAEAIAVVDGGKREISMGYSCELSFEDGTAPDGTPYQAVQRGIRINHLAIVDSARGGTTLRIGDSQMPKMSTFDGLPYETTDAAEAVITKLTGNLKVLADAAEKQITDHAAVVAAKDAELAKRDATIDDLKSKVLDAAALDARVAARASLVSKAKTIAPNIVTDGKTDAEIKRAVVVAKFGDAANGQPDAYIDARFDIMVEDGVKPDPLAAGIAGQPIITNDAKAEAEAARAARFARYGTAHNQRASA